MAERWSRRPCASSMPMSAIKAVHASRGKVVRAQPVAALYEQSRIHHVGAFPALEDQICAFTTDFDRAQLKAAGCEKVFREKIIGTTADWPQLAKLMKALAPGDVVITRPLTDSRAMQPIFW
jgi:hypothetical protein